MSHKDVLFAPPNYVYHGDPVSSIYNPALTTSNAPLIIDNSTKYGYVEVSDIV